MKIISINRVSLASWRAWSTHCFSFYFYRDKIRIMIIIYSTIINRAFGSDSKISSRSRIKKHKAIHHACMRCLLSLPLSHIRFDVIYIDHSPLTLWMRRRLQAERLSRKYEYKYKQTNKGWYAVFEPSKNEIHNEQFFFLCEQRPPQVALDTHLNRIDK